MKTHLSNYKFIILAYSKHNETACLFELINPVPSRNLNNITGLTVSCDKDKWSDALQNSYNIYRVAVFLWILIGLSWIGGVVNIITNFFQCGMNDLRYGASLNQHCNFIQSSKTAFEKKMVDGYVGKTLYTVEV